LRFFIFVFLINFLFAQTDFIDSFITKFEYGKMLYNNPRGISCVKCHAKDAKGKIIVTFTHHYHKKEYICTIKTKDITKISKDDFFAKLDSSIPMKKRKFDKTQVCQKLTYGNSMPKYFLTKDELESIYFYITHEDEYE